MSRGTQGYNKRDRSIFTYGIITLWDAAFQPLWLILCFVTLLVRRHNLTTPSLTHFAIVLFLQNNTAIILLTQTEIRVRQTIQSERKTMAKWVRDGLGFSLFARRYLGNNSPRHIFASKYFAQCACRIGRALGGRSAAPTRYAAIRRSRFA